MRDVLDNSLYVQDPKKFYEVFQIATQFNSLYNGHNIIQDDIFSILTNYAKKNQISLELLRFPTKDDDFCALTCVQKGKIFVYVNSWLPLSNQIFAAAHELYHVWCFIEKMDESVLRKGSFLSAAIIDEGIANLEDQKANAFAGLLLAPSNALHEQMEIYGVSKEKQSLEDIVQLMGIFSMPYKAVLLRLFEEQYIDERTVREFLNIEKNRIKKFVGYESNTYRWQRRTPEIIQLGNLIQVMEQNIEFDLLTDTRVASDQKTIHQILQRYKNI